MSGMYTMLYRRQTSPAEAAKAKALANKMVDAQQELEVALKVLANRKPLAQIYEEANTIKDEHTAAKAKTTPMAEPNAKAKRSLAF